MNNSNRFFGYQDQKHTEGIQFLSEEIIRTPSAFQYFLGCSFRHTIDAGKQNISNYMHDL